MKEKKATIIGISGGSGCGKTTIINALRDHFDESTLCILSQDNYYRPRENQKTDPTGKKNFDLPESIYNDELVRDIECLIDGKDVVRQEYVFNNSDAKAEELIFRPAEIIIVEGLFVLHHAPLVDLMDYKVFINAKENLKLIRRIKRDNAERNYPIDDVLYRYEHHVLPSYEKYIYPYMDDCDIIINNNEGFEKGLEFLIGFVQSKVS